MDNDLKSLLEGIPAPYENDRYTNLTLQLNAGVVMKALWAVEPLAINSLNEDIRKAFIGLGHAVDRALAQALTDKMVKKEL